MVSGPTTDLIEYMSSEGKTLSIQKFEKDGVKMVTVNDIELTLDSLISMIIDLNLVGRPDSDSESESEIVVPDSDSDEEEIMDERAKNEEEFRGLVFYSLSVYMIIVSIIAALILTNVLR